MTGATPSAPPAPPPGPQSTLLLLVRHGETPTTGSVLPGRTPVQQSPSSFHFPNGESFLEMQARIVGALEAMCTAHAGGVVVCFSHADPIKAAVAHALGTHLDRFQRIVISPGSVSAISYNEGRAPTVLMVNTTSDPLNGLRAP